jgi:hypothetical protein
MAGAAGMGGAAGTAGAGGNVGNAGTAGSGEGGGGSQTCGNGKVEGTEECDNAVDGTPWKGDDVCADDCETVTTAECLTCEQSSDCSGFTNDCAGFAAAKDVANCYDNYQCLRENHCLDGTNTLGGCYCGSLSTGACGGAPFDLSQPGAPDGPCAALMQAGHPGTTNNSAVLGLLQLRTHPAGAAGKRFFCDRFTDANCGAACGIAP